MDTNTWLAEIELLESGEVTAAKYIKVKNSDIEGKTDAQLATYFNNSSPVEKPCLKMKPHTEVQQ